MLRDQSLQLQLQLQSGQARISALRQHAHLQQVSTVALQQRLQVCADLAPSLFQVQSIIADYHRLLQQCFAQQLLSHSASTILQPLQSLVSTTWGVRVHSWRIKPEVHLSCRQLLQLRRQLLRQIKTIASPHTRRNIRKVTRQFFYLLCYVMKKTH